MAILGALARMRVGPPRNGREPATEGCTRVPTGAGRSADESGMLGPDAFKHDSRELAAADKKADEADEEREDELRGLWQPYFQSRVFARHPPFTPFPLCMRFLCVCPILSDFGHVSRFLATGKN